MTWLAKDEPEDLFSLAAWREWRDDVARLPDTIENKLDLLALADGWIADLSAPTSVIDKKQAGA
ncbi:hypothetical protein [Zavarzinia aquatilis]|uniref:Uncharacterized protein n=1 Tax=Zavarzinia aquatilis TaxID=2211142 RepID=A0A317DTK0_9PROT|nr:hypothetical protein [Zavarzinia aquatilis]PWR17682.1 hypothetical protein DKG74_20555 [Zavarzinia aquatilis]